MTHVYLEVGKKRVFAYAADWPGWRRSGRDEEQALEALSTSASRYAVLAALAGIPFDPVDEVDCIEIAALARIRAAILAEIRVGVVSGPPGGLARSRRPARFVARRTAWHAVDHAWEIQDKQEP